MKQTIATLATLASVNAYGCGVANPVKAHSYNSGPQYSGGLIKRSFGYRSPGFGKRSYGYDSHDYGYDSHSDSYGYDDEYSHGEDYGYGDDYDLDYGYGNSGRSYGNARSYGGAYGSRGGVYGGVFGKRNYAKRSYGAPSAYGKRSSGYGPHPAYSSSPSYGKHSYGSSRSLGHNGYEPVVVKKDYGLWENYYRLEVETFKKTVVTDTENVWVIAYIDPACGGCKKLAQQWEKVTTLETITVRKVKFGYLDVTVEANKEILQTYTGGYKVTATPSVLLYGQDKYAPSVYDGDFTVSHLNDYICGYCDDYGFGESYGLDYGYGDSYDGGYGYGDSYDRGYGYGRRGGYGKSYASPRYGGSYGYNAEPKILSTYGKTSSSRVEDIDYDRTVREGRSYGGYERTSVEPLYDDYGYDSYDW